LLRTLQSKVDDGIRVLELCLEVPRMDPFASS
jgi:hypothetical protein